uniref:tRNA (guanine(26)-N(2))-dimethyltransferase n=2 Tax=Schistocephalus solidus TaxID=70667 RepID=A0A0V0J5X1_SCHSO
MLTVASEELEDCPFYMQVDQLASVIRTSPPKMTELRSAFLNAGYRVSFSHAATASLKTDAPPSFIWDVMCAWKRRVEVAKATAASEPSDSARPSPQKTAEEEEAKTITLEDSGTDDEMRTKRPDVDGRAVVEQKAAKRKSQGKKHPPSEAALRVEATLMERPHNPRVDFTPHPNANPSSRVEGLLRYQLNPLPNWGPKARARSVKKPILTALKEPGNLTATKQPRNHS